MVNTVRVSANHGRDVILSLTTIKKLRNFTKEENRGFSAFRFSLHLMLEQALSNLIICMVISQKLHTKVAQIS